MIFKGKNFLVVGGGESGEAAVKALLQLGARVLLWDDGKSAEAEARVGKLTAAGALNVSNEPAAKVLDDVYCVVLSPGVPIDAPIVEAGKARGIRVTGETELGYLLCKAPVLAVTGTNGKSTTISLIHELLRAGGKNSRLLGNIGTPLTQDALTLSEGDFVCLEVSSFQLETVHSFTPHIAAVLNVTPDHLNRHGTMENYRRIKYRIFERQTETEYAVANADDEAISLHARTLKSDVFYYSAKREVRGTYVEEGRMFFRDGPVKEYIIDTQDIGIIGEHNLYNALCAATFARIAGVSAATIGSTLKTFRGIKHRLQYVCSARGKSFYNDSKGTNIGSTLCAVKAMRAPTVLILGGSDKGYEFDELFANLPSSIVHTVLMGDTRYKLLEAAVRCNFHSVSVCQDLSAAVRIAYLRTPPEGNVLLSPACASFDQFKNYEERGDRFIRLAEELHEKDGI